MSVCFEVTEDDAYIVTYDDLLNAGVPLDQIDPRRMELIVDGKPEPIYVFGEANGRFDPTDTLLFYGRYPRGKTTTRRPENDTNFYYLRWDSDRPARYRAPVPFSATDPREYPVINWFRRTIRFERDYAFEKFYHPNGEETDFYFWLKLVPGLPIEERSITVDHNIFRGLPSEIFPDTFDLKIKFYGLSQGTVSPQHHLWVYIGDTRIGEAMWDGVKEYVLDLAGLPVDLLSETGSTTIEFRFTEEREAGWIIDSLMLDWVELTFWHDTHSRDGKTLLFNTFDQPLEKYRVLVSGIEGEADDVVLINLTHKEVFRPGPVPTREGDGFYYLFYPHAGRPAEYVMVNHRKIGAPPVIRPVYDLDIFGAGQQTDMIIISHSEFLDEAEQWAAYRRADGLSVLVVELQSIFDRYSHGFLKDTAIRDYLKHTWSAYPDPAPKYAMLVGDATWDTKGLRFPEDRNLVPIHWHATPIWRWGGYPSENWFVAFGEDELRPEMAIGRIPVNQVGQLSAVLEKVRSYENLTTRRRPPRWANRAILLASATAMFHQVLDSLEENILGPAGFQSELFEPTVATVEDDTEFLQRAIDNGASLLYFHGHGGAFNWRVGPIDYASQRDLFTADTVRELRNRGRYPLILATSCYTVSFDNYLSIGEVFLMEPRKGAAAVVATAWKSYAQHDHLFHTRLMEILFRDDVQRLGDAFTLAKQQLHEENAPDEILRSMLILGDPALRVYRPRR